MYFDSNQLLASLTAVFVTASMASLLVFYRGRHRSDVRRWAVTILCACALLAAASWTRFGELHGIWVDAPGATAGAQFRRKLERHQPFHFHEFFHYYIGAKYFRDLGYEGLYECAALADKQNAEDLGVRGHTAEWVRDLDDILSDMPAETAMSRCQTDYVAKMPAAHWAAFRADLRELQTLVPDDWWRDVVSDAGFNPPPSWILLGSALANLIPIHFAGAPTYLVATSLDMVLLIACFLVLRRYFGTAVAATAAVYFGASFIASYQWNGGAYLRYTWISSLVFGLAAAKRQRWVLAGALLGASACDRIFPAGFAVGAAIPLAIGAIHSQRDRLRLGRFALGFAGAVSVLVLASLVVFGFDAWRVFAMRIGRHGDVYFVMHLGLKKILTWGPWVAAQNFHGHAGLQRFHDWNVHLRDAWAKAHGLAIAVQLLVTGGAALAATKRRPYEAALLFGIVVMFCFSLPANYYYVVLALVPALLLRSAVTTPSAEGKLRDWGLLSAFALFWLTTFVAPKIEGDDIVYNHIICVALFAFLLAWIAAWRPWQGLRALARSGPRPDVRTPVATPPAP